MDPAAEPHAPAAPARIGASLRERLGRVRLLVLDVDGVMTDGSIVSTESGGEVYRFNVKDGAGIVLARSAGLEFGLLTGRRSVSVERRAAELGITRVLQGVADKAEGLSRMLSGGPFDPPSVAYMGDDVFDLPAFRVSGVTACPADAHPLVVRRADYVCSRGGGSGAVREFIDLLLDAQGHLDSVERRFWEGRDDA